MKEEMNGKRKKFKKGGSKEVIFLRHLPAALKFQFKAWCYKRGITMKRALTDYMKEVLNKDARELGDKPQFPLPPKKGTKFQPRESV